jgi:hypothetical protein
MEMLLGGKIFVGNFPPTFAVNIGQGAKASFARGFFTTPTLIHS